MSSRFEIEKSFPASHAGERVGWAELHQVPNGDDRYIGVNVALATVGSEGAQVGYQILTNPDGEESLPHPVAKGFLAATAFSGFLLQEPHRGAETNLFSRVGGDSYFDHPDRLLTEGILAYYHKQQGTEKVWSTSVPDFLDTLRQQFIDVSLPRGYQDMYYWMNGSAGRDLSGKVVSFNGMSERDFLMADPSMASLTAEQIDHVSALLETYKASARNDATMRQNLTVLADIPNEAIPDAFVASREQAAQYERDAAARSEELVIQRLGYIPSGHGPRARTWPYMDPAGRDAQQQYGRELDALKADNPYIADVELGRELAELEGREQFAAEALRRFRLLHFVETEK